MRKVKIIDSPMTIKEVEENIAYSDTIHWIEFENIVGIDYVKSRRLIKNDPDMMHLDNNYIDYGFLISNYVLEPYLYLHNKYNFLSELSQELPKVLRFASKVARNLYAFSPAFNVQYASQLISKENVYESLAVAKEEYSTANECEKIYLSALYLEFFENIFCLGNTRADCIPFEYFNQADRTFLSEIKSFACKAEILQKNCRED